jgi:hypothetical protein
LAKYLSKSFELRADKGWAEKMGLLPGMSLYKFYRWIYAYQDGQKIPLAKVARPHKTTATFVNDDANYTARIREELAPYLEVKDNQKLRWKKPAQQIFWEREPQIKEWKGGIALVKSCLRWSSQRQIKQNSFWKPCELDYENRGNDYYHQKACREKANGSCYCFSNWNPKCVMITEHHTTPILRCEFEFRGPLAYANYQRWVVPLLAKVNLPRFAKFANYQPSETDYQQFEELTERKWADRELGNYRACQPDWDQDQAWRAAIPKELIYNEIYLWNVRGRLREYSSSSGPNWGAIYG